jgi:hypothetical protein
MGKREKFILETLEDRLITANERSRQKARSKTIRRKQARLGVECTTVTALSILARYVGNVCNVAE